MTTEEKKEEVKAIVTLKALAASVEELLQDQKKFFKTRDPKLLAKCKAQEESIARWCNQILRHDSQTKIF